MDRSMLAALPLLMSLILLPAASPDPGAPNASSASVSLPWSLRTDVRSILEPRALSHLRPHLMARPPAELLHPLGDESLQAIIKGYDPERERVLTEQLLAANLHCRVLRVAAATNGAMTAALVKLQAGDKQSGLFALADIQQDASRVIKIGFAALPELGHLDVWATVPWDRDNEPVHRPVFTLSVPRRKVESALSLADRPEDLLAHCGGIRVGAEFLDYAIDGPGSANVLPTAADALLGPALDRAWGEFGKGARTSGELDGLTSEGPVRALLRGPATATQACLTIDDGPHPLMTPLILDVLRRENAKATFFVVGEKVEQYPELARMIVRDGHELANHTYSHPRLGALNPRGVWTQMRACDRAVERACGLRQMRWFRPPGGDCTEETLRVVEALDYTTVMWTANTGDWIGIGPERITANALAELKPGGIILMHQDGLQSIEALPGIIQGAREAGLGLGTVGEVAGQDSVTEVLPRDLLPLMRRAHIDL